MIADCPFGHVVDVHFTSRCAMQRPASEGERYVTHSWAVSTLSHRPDPEASQDQRAHLHHDPHEYYPRSATSHTPGFGPYLAPFPPGASHCGVCAGSGLEGFGQGLPWPPHRSPSPPVQGFPCPLRWTLQRGVGGGSLLIPTALCSSQPGGR